MDVTPDFRSKKSDSLRIGMFQVVSGLALLIYAILVVSLSGGDTESADFVGLIILTLYSYYLVNVVHAEYLRGDLASPLSLFFSGCLLYFGLTGILYYDTDFFVSSANRQYYLSGVFYTFAFCVSFHLAYLALRRVSSARVRTAPRRWRTRAVIGVAIIMAGFGAASRVVIINSGMYLWSGVVSAEAIGLRMRNIAFWAFGSSVADIAGWMLWTHFLTVNQDGRRRPALFLMTIGVLVGNLLYWIPTGSKLNIATALVVPFFIYYLVRQRLPGRTQIIVCVLALAFMFPATHVLREAQREMLSAGGTAQGLSQVLAVTFGAAERSGTVRETGANGRIFGRLDEHEVVAGAVRVVNQGNYTPRYGLDYINAFVNLIPRIVWPDKPYVMYGNEFGHMVGIIGYQDIGTSIAPTYIGESYLNFGPFGLLVAPLLCAVFFVFYRRLTGPQRSETAILLYVSAIPTLLYIDGSFGLYISSQMRIWAVIGILSWLMAARARTGAQPYRLSTAET